MRQAARIYFGKELKDVSLAEAATIAGMIQGPARYSPLHHPEAAQARKIVVLESMLRDSWITSEQANSASKARAPPAAPCGKPSHR